MMSMKRNKMNYQRKVLALFCDNNDYEWAEKYATAEILNSSSQGLGYPFIIYLIDHYHVSERMLRLFVKKGLKLVSCVLFDDNPIHAACKTLQCHLIPFLARNGVDIDGRGNNEHTPLTASLYGYKNKNAMKVVETLLYEGAAVSGYRQRGRTVMQIAKEQGEKYVSRIQCRMVMDAFVECAKKKKLCCPDMIHIIRDYIWSLRCDWLMNQPPPPPPPNKK